MNTGLSSFIPLTAHSAGGLENYRRIRHEDSTSLLWAYSEAQSRV
ncbi:hypothetical protein [Aneurinibacillus tyrosinisolvens]|nr:hypothetical protein [Aneurinibacillus tyrosinisolvens]